MNNDLKVSLENIIPLTYARDHFSSIVAEVQRDKLYILTKGGKPAIALIDVRYLEQITAGVFNKAKIEKDIEKIPEQVGKPKMLEHEQEIKDEKLEIKDAKTEPTKPFDKPQGKPAGFAAPRPTSGQAPQPKIEPKPQSKADRPLADTPPPAGFAAPQPKAPAPISPPKPLDSAQGKPAPISPLPQKEEFDLNKYLPKDNPPDLSKKTIPISEKPAPNLPPPSGPAANKPLAFPTNEIKKPENATPTIDVNFNQDAITDKQEKVSDNKGLSPDDKVQPAQYAGENPEEPEEMAID